MARRNKTPPNLSLMFIQYPDRLEQFFLLTQAALPGAGGMLLTDMKGKPVWQTGDMLGDDVIRQIISETVNHDITAGPLESVCGRSGERAWSLPLLNPHKEVIGHLILSGSQWPDGEDQRRMRGVALGYLSEAVSNEQAILQELDTMAEELTARYEELNLAYEEDSSDSDEFRYAQDALNSLVTDSAEYLDSAFSLLYVPSHGLETHYSTPRRKLNNRQDILRELESNVFDWIQKNDRGLVVNSIEDPIHAKACPGLPAKIAAIPLRNSRKQVIGMITCLRFTLGRDYTNSDRNLLDVLARKVTKVLDLAYDDLTGLMRRSGFEHFVRNALEEAEDRNLKHCVLSLDISQLHILNDRGSFEEGDRLIQEVSRVISSHIRDTDQVSRLDGGNFIILLQNCPAVRGNRVAEHLLEDISRIEVEAEDEESRFDVAAAIGLREIDVDTKNVESAISGAQIACKTAKERGRNVISVYSVEDSELLEREEHMRVLGTVQWALRNNGFDLFSQTIRPIDPANTHMHYEVLVRMRNADGELVPPGAFLPAAERYQLMPAVDRWVIRNTLATLQQYWPQLASMDTSWAVNISGQSLGSGEIVEFLRETLNEFQIPPQVINIEITETVAVGNLEQACRIIQGIRELGCPVSLDDFGTGLSTFSYLKQLPVDFLKIDGSFIVNILDDPVSRVMVESIHHVGHAMGLKTIAEYVENHKIEDCLREIGIDFSQGYAIAKPIPINEQLDAIVQPSNGN